MVLIHAFAICLTNSLQVDQAYAVADFCRYLSRNIILTHIPAHITITPSLIINIEDSVQEEGCANEKQRTTEEILGPQTIV